MAKYTLKHRRHAGRPLADYEILKLCADKLMISPYLPEKVRQVDGRPVVSYGLSSYGYDIRLAGEMVFVDKEALDPKATASKHTVGVRRKFKPHEAVVIPPGRFVLGESLEHFTIPQDVIGLGFGKSTYARLGLQVLITPLEPNWHGILTIALLNATQHSIVVYPHEGIVQVVFFRGARPQSVYSGPYQGQTGVTLPRVRTQAQNETAPPLK